jgi:hypothetical protein
MRKSTLVLAAFVILSATACASMKSDSGLGRARVNVIKPEILISQTSEMPAAARHMQGAIPIQYAMRVANRSAETITLKRVTVQSMGMGAYRIDATGRPFDTLIQPDEYQIVEFWVPANVVDNTIMGANGPVTLRATLQFDSPVGQFQEIVVQQVNAMPGRGAR